MKKALYGNQIIDVLEAKPNEQGYKWTSSDRQRFFKENEIEILDTENKCICEIIREYKNAEVELADDCYTGLRMGYGWIAAVGEGEAKDYIQYCPYCGKKFELLAQEEKNNIIKKATEWLYMNLDMPEVDKHWWVEDFCNYLDIALD